MSDQNYSLYAFIVDPATGIARQFVCCNSEADLANFVMPAEFTGCILVPFTEEGKPSEYTTGLDGEGQIEFVYLGAPTISLDLLKFYRWEAVKELRAAKEQGGISMPGIGVFHSDPVSLMKAATYAQTASIYIMQGTPELFEVSITMLDNTDYEPSASEMIALHLYGSNYINEVHAYSQELRALIDAAVSPEDLEVINITTGWPV
jgi:hypothetical protein